MPYDIFPLFMQNKTKNIFRTTKPHLEEIIQKWA